MWLGCCALSNVSAAERVLEIFSLEHTLVDQVLTSIRPLLDPGGTATGMGNQLIVKTSPQNLAEIKRVLSALDRRPKMLRITVRQDVAQDSHIRDDRGSGRLGRGDVRVAIPDRGPRGGASATIRGADGEFIRYRTLSTTSSGEQDNTYFVTTLEGQTAFVETGISLPYPHSSVTYDGYHTRIHEGVDYRRLSSGFFVIPRTHGAEVSLEIAPQLETIDPRYAGRIDTRYSQTTVTARLGEWFQLGGVNEVDDSEQGRLLARTRRHDAEDYQVWVLVEELP